VGAARQEWGGRVRGAKRKLPGITDARRQVVYPQARAAGLAATAIAGNRVPEALTGPAERDAQTSQDPGFQVQHGPDRRRINHLPNYIGTWGTTLTPPPTPLPSTMTWFSTGQSYSYPAHNWRGEIECPTAPHFPPEAAGVEPRIQ
jgi:hypothetical protein